MIPHSTASSKNCQGSVSSLVLATLLLVPFLTLVSATPHLPLRAQPAVLALAAERPDALVPVIVQKTGRTAGVEATVTREGGVVTKDLHIINAFAAMMPGHAVPALARATGVHWISLDGPVENSLLTTSNSTSSSVARNTYLDTLQVGKVWAMGRQGEGIGVAVIDSGVSEDRDFRRLERPGSFNPNSTTVDDVYGHGTHVAGIIGGNGADSENAIQGIAPEANLISLKISDEQGMAYESDTVRALQWVYDNKARHNIRVVSLSINAKMLQSYHTSPLNAAVEILWFNGVVVVASSGNTGALGTGNTINAAPANDPFIITVGASDEKRTASRADDAVAPYSAYGLTLDAVRKPDVIAPGSHIVSVLSKDSSWAAEHPDRVVDNGQYFRLSGTSMAAPMVAGAVALLLQDEPTLTPDQVKYRLMHTGGSLPGHGTDLLSHYAYLNVYALVTGTTTASANTGLPASQLLWTGSDLPLWNSVNWNSVNWNSVNWNSVNWNSVNWNSVNWNSVTWND